jgi:hypothetical protein
LAAILSSAAAGAAAAGLAGTLIGLGIPKEEAEFYEGQVSAGHVLVTVQADGRNAGPVRPASTAKARRAQPACIARALRLVRRERPVARNALAQPPAAATPLVTLP